MRGKLVCLTVLAAGTVASGPAPAAPMQECPPDAPPATSCVITIDDHAVDDGLCAFPVQVDAVGKILYTPRYRKGVLVGESFRPNIKIQVTNPANGRFFTDRDVGLDKATFNPDGSTVVLSTGLHFKVRTSDNKTIFRRIGLQIIHITPDGEESTEIRGGNFDPEDAFPAIACDFLAGP
jgi:hypothetical protein